jgi:hypothetical protein
MEATSMAVASMPKRKDRSTVAATERKAAKRQKPRSADAVKATIVMSGDLHFVLGSVAARRSMDRSELAVKLIKQGLRTKTYSDLYNALLPFTTLGDEETTEESTSDTDRQSE